MKRAAGASFWSTLLLLLCFLQVEGVAVGSFGTGPVRSHHERSHDVHEGVATKRAEVTFKDGMQGEKSGTAGESSNNWEHTRTHSEEKRAAPKMQVTTHTTTTANSERIYEERSDGNTYHGRSSTNGVTVEDKNVRTGTHHHYGGGTTERTNYGPRPSPPTRSTHLDKRGRGSSHTLDGAATGCRHGAECNRNGGNDENDTTYYSSTQQSNEEWRDRHSSSDKANVHEGSPRKCASHWPSLEERTEGDEEERPEAHPIGLISALNGRGTEGRSMDLDARELDATVNIIAAAWIGFSVLVFILFCVSEIARKRRQKDTESPLLMRVFQYLHVFDTDDIDIQLSAVGGFHVGYLNELANGINKKQPPNKKIDTAHHSSFRAKKEGDQQSDTSLSDNSENSTGLSDKV